jgi:hypothetical protein
MSLVKKAQNNNEFNFEDLSQAKDEDSFDFKKHLEDHGFKVYEPGEERDPNRSMLDIGKLREESKGLEPESIIHITMDDDGLEEEEPEDNEEEMESTIHIFDDSSDDEPPKAEVAFEINDDEPQYFEFHLPSLPGINDSEDDDIQGELDVEEVEDEVEIAELDKWDWESRGLSQFLPWLQDIVNKIPTYSANEPSGMERAYSYLQNLDSIISKALRKDINGDINISQLDAARSTIRDGMVKLEKALEKEMASRKRKRAGSDPEYRAGLVKNAQKISGVNRTTITVDILLARVAKVCINGTISAGKDIEDLFKKQVKAYDLNIREQASVLQLLEEMGYPIRRDRGVLPGEDIDPRSEDNFDWMASYQN